jgi:hypothetical protein
MQAVRQIVDAEQLSSFVKMSEDMRHIPVEIIVLPVVRENPVDMKATVNYEALEKAYGGLSDYAHPAMIPQEKNAWQTAVLENAEKGKYGIRVDYP